jgi:hypothetical protein
VLFDLGVELVKRDAREQTPKIARFAQRVLVILGMDEETAVRRLDNIFRIDTSP